jgi:hypothetical protein
MSDNLSSSVKPNSVLNIFGMIASKGTYSKEV